MRRALLSLASVVLAAPALGQESLEALDSLRLSSSTFTLASLQGDDSFIEPKAEAGLGLPPLVVQYARPLATGQWRLQIPARVHHYDGLRDGRRNLTPQGVFTLPQGYTETGEERADGDADLGQRYQDT